MELEATASSVLAVLRLRFPPLPFAPQPFHFEDCEDGHPGRGARHTRINGLSRDQQAPQPHTG